MPDAMISSQKATETEFEPNPKFEFAWSRAQTLLHALIGLVILAGLLGAFGNGWLSKSNRSFTAVPLSVTYQRFMRANAPNELILTATAPLPAETIEIGIGSELLDSASISVTQLEPRPSELGRVGSWDVEG